MSLIQKLICTLNILVRAINVLVCNIFKYTFSIFDIVKEET